MTTRLYYDDPYLKTFDASVISCDQEDGRFTVVLDRTAFYPTSGGQPFDVGTLGEATVRDVVERDETIVHVVDRALQPGASVSGRIDWRRRFDHMQQHTGQHVLSAAFDRLFAARTESFHLGTTAATIDLAKEVTPQQIRDAEDESNRIVWEDRPVTIRFATEEEARGLPLRKESLRSGALRLIEVREFDLSACGGTHVERTGAIGIIAISSREKFRGGTRVEFLCGGRALSRFREWRDVLSATTQRVSVLPPELPDAVERLQLEAKGLQRTVRDQQEQLAKHEAAALISRAQPAGERLVVVEAIDGWDVLGLKALATAASAKAPAAAIALFNRSGPSSVVIAAGAESGVDAAATLKALTAQFGGRGGGRRELAQGGGFGAPLERLLDAARVALSE